MAAIAVMFVIAAVVGLSDRQAYAQAPGGQAAGPPLPNGEALYLANCVECHGVEGDAVTDVDLGHGRFRRATTDPELVGIVLRGIPGTGMPPSTFSEAEAAAIVRFLRAKANRAAASAGQRREWPGDLRRQGQVHDAAIASTVLARERGRISVTSAGFAIPQTSNGRSSNRTSTSFPATGFVRLVTRDGVTVTGRLLNHDTFTVQVLDAKEQLQSLQRANLREFTFLDKSPMPPYSGKLSSDEVTDLVSYLVSLREGP